MRRFGIIAVAVCSLSLLAASANAGERTPVRLLDNAQVAAGATTSADVTPVRFGFGWRGFSYYPGYARPYYGNYGYGNYGGYGGYGSYYRPWGGYGGYYNAYRPYYGGYYRW
jgi:hypothetical protein